MVRTKSSEIAKLIDASKALTKGLEALQDTFTELQIDRETLKELQPLVKKVKSIYFPGEPDQETPATEPPAKPLVNVCETCAFEGDSLACDRTDATEKDDIIVLCPAHESKNTDEENLADIATIDEAERVAEQADKKSSKGKKNEPKTGS